MPLYITAVDLLATRRPDMSIDRTFQISTGFSVCNVVFFVVVVVVAVVVVVVVVVVV